MFILDVRNIGAQQPVNSPPSPRPINSNERMFGIQYANTDGSPAILYLRESAFTNGRVSGLGSAAQLDYSALTREELNTVINLGIRTTPGVTYPIARVATRAELDQEKKIKIQHVNVDTFQGR